MDSSSVVIPSDHGEEEVDVPERGAWEGSDVTADEIEWLRQSRWIPPGVECQLPGGKLMPELCPGEFVVFVAHFKRGFELPVSDLMKKFFEKFDL
jgi:hypothetical protein